VKAAGATTPALFSTTKGGGEMRQVGSGAPRRSHRAGRSDGRGGRGSLLYKG
jgi:hypothetical protein